MSAIRWTTFALAALCGCQAATTKPEKSDDPIIIVGTDEDCGDGVLQAGEACDPGIEAPAEGSCPTSCSGGDTCAPVALVGSADECSARCESSPPACRDGDGCCPIGCDSGNDDDCTNTCGDGVVEGPETCDGNCPEICQSQSSCATATRTGEADLCNVVCESVPATECVDGDGCCPDGCRGQDDDCSESCGNGVLDEGETCDGDCPTSCDDGASCTADTMVGSPQTCNVVCETRPVDTCVAGDQCCPSNCNRQNDADCACAPTTSCNALAFECGSVFDGCSDVNCGTCRGTTTCVNNSCVETFGIGEPCAAGAADCEICFSQERSAWAGGYCSKRCPTDCGAAAHCVDFPDLATAICMSDCTSDADCRSGYVCADIDGASGSECVPTANGTTKVGGACTVINDCTGGLDGICWSGALSTPDGYCTKRCSTDSDCGTGAHCSQERCYADCSSSTDCRTGYLCFDPADEGRDSCLPAGLGDGQVGDACEYVRDCSGGEYAICGDVAATPNGYCTILCGPGEGTCPAESFCYDVGNQPICVDECSENTDCRNGYRCIFDSNLDPIRGFCWGI